MNPESFCTCIYVYNPTSVTVEAAPAAALGANNDLVLIRLDDARTRVRVQRSTPTDLARGIYRMHTATAPDIHGGSDVETVIVPDKDRPPDPTVREAFRRAFPGVDYDKLKGFVKEDTRSFDLAGSASAKTGSK